jgi:hypothetical protein
MQCAVPLSVDCKKVYDSAVWEVFCEHLMGFVIPLKLLMSVKCVKGKPRRADMFDTSHSRWSEGATAPPVIFNACFKIALAKVLAYQEGLKSNGGRWRLVRADGFNLSGGNVNTLSTEKTRNVC